MKVVGNVLWLLLGGIGMSLAYVIAAFFAIIFIVTIPFAVPCFRLASYSLWPFGRTLVKNPNAGGGSTLGNIIWFLFFGWWLALGHLVSAVFLAISIVGLPFAVAQTKIAVAALWPFGTTIVPANSLPEGQRGIVLGGQHAVTSALPAAPAVATANSGPPALPPPSSYAKPELP